MNLAMILGVCLLSVGSPQSAPPTVPTAPQSQSSEPAQSRPAPAGQTPNSAVPAKPTPTRPRRHKKAVPNCSNAPAALNPAASADPTKATGFDSTNASPKPLPPCPPPKKVVRNGGSNEPAEQLVEGTTAEQAAQQRSIDELTAATSANLKKLESRQLSTTQQDMVSQVKQFMDQSKAAVAAGDLERGQNLATKAHLLSDELVKP